MDYFNLDTVLTDQKLRMIREIITAYYEMGTDDDDMSYEYGRACGTIDCISAVLCADEKSAVLYAGEKEGDGQNAE